MDKIKKQTNRFSDAELNTIKSTFSENDDLIKALRKHFLQLPLSAVDQAILGTIKGKEAVLKVIRKAYLPEIDGDAPIHQVVDLLLTLKIDDKTPELAYPHILARHKLIEYIDGQLKFLEVNGNAANLNFVYLGNIDNKKADDAYVDLLARNTFISHNEQQLSMFLLLAGRKDETPEQTMARIQKDSTK